jgi:PPOX class probable F420-dependent enzyme
MSMGSLAIELPDWAALLVEEAQVAHLGLTDDRGRPRVLPVTFAPAHGAVWSAVDDKPKRTRDLARVRWLRRRPEAALTVDRYSDEWDELAWVQLLGAVTIVDDPAAAPAAIEALCAKYVPYRQRPPAGPLLRLDPQRALHWRAKP